ncbi:MAG: VWA domain-containing protein [Vicinamibacterales bacterium]
MHLSLTYFWPLVLLAILPFVWWMRRRTLTNFHERQLVMQAVARSLVVGGLAVALTQPVLSWAGRRVAIVYVVDASQSVAEPEVTRALDWIDAANASGHPDISRIVLFGANAVSVANRPEAEAVLAAPQRTEETAGAASNQVGRLDRGRTNISAAIREAMQHYPSGYVKRLVLLSDGRETVGRVSDDLALLQREGVRVFTAPVAPRAVDDAWMASVETPETVSVDEPFDVKLKVFSHEERTATIELHAGGKTILTKTQRLAAGDNTIALTAHVSDPGAQILEAVVLVPGDGVAQNNRIRKSVYVDEKPRVLYVEGRPQSARYLIRALEEGGFVVDLASPTKLPTSPGRLRGYTAVVVSDVNRSLITDPQMEALRRYVSELGGGFVMVGGESVYGADGYAKTTIEDMLPVTFNIKDKPDEFAMVVVLDKSWSMSGPKMELSKEAAKAAVDVLQDTHQFALVAFNNGFDWPIPMQSVKNRVRIKERISEIQPSGHTNIYPALEEAYKALLKTDAKNKHVILLSDGRTYTDDFEGLTNKMVASKITVSCIAVGDQADRELLGDIAKWGKGRNYYIEDAREVPQIFTDETQKAQKKTLVEEPFRPKVEKDVGMFRGIDFTAAPLLKGFTNTQAKDTADLLLVSATGTDKQPILARWQFGLGRTTAFLSDTKDRWAADWLTWPAYGKFWTQVVRDVMRVDSDRARRFRVERDGDLARVHVEAVDADGMFTNDAAPKIEMTSARGGSKVLDVQQVGPGNYVTTVNVGDRGDYAFRLVSDDPKSQAARTLPANYNPELQSYPPDEALLKGISADTGGAFAPKAADVFSARGDTAPIKRQLWPYLAALALAAYFVDMVLRRLRFFEYDAVA